MKSNTNKVARIPALAGLFILTIFIFLFLHPKYPNNLQGYYTQELKWKTCYQDYQCTDLLVPIDYTNLKTGTFHISVVKYEALGTDKIGSLIVNPGGPGASGVDYAYAAEYIFSPDILEHYDIVGFDPRGVSRSEPIRCLSDKELDANYASDPKPDNEKEFQQMIEDTKKYITKCKDNNKHLSAFSTASVARDLDILRQAVGDKQLNYMGKSYGTYLGTLYAHFFPDKVGRVVLDGAVDPTISNYQQSLTQAVGFEQAFSAFHKDCLAKKNCPLPKSKVDAVTLMKDIFNDSATKPLPTKKKSKRTASESLIVLGTASAMYDSKTGWSQLRKAITEGKIGYGDTFLQLADEYTGRGQEGTYPSNDFDSGAIIDCLDFQETRTTKQIQNDVASFTKSAPLFGPYLAYGGLTCKYFHPAKETRIAPTKTVNPVVVIGTTGDPATPYEWAQGLHKLLTNSVLLSLTGEGHTGQGQGNSCIDNQIDAFFLKNQTPRTSSCT